MRQSVRDMLHGGVDHSRLESKYHSLLNEKRTSIGYPVNQDWDFSELFKFLEVPVNNVGDPFQHSNYKLNTLEFEQEVIDAFAHFTQAPDDQCWGYVTSGGTEGNMYGLYLARELYPKGMVYFSEETHYSVAKILRLQHTPSIMLRAQENGEMDYEDLRESLRINRHLPPILFVNIGTTMKGAIDNLDKIKEILNDLAIRDYYIHCDGALHGMAMSFIDNPPAWNFADGADSISISGHKWLGAPIPCGVALAKNSHVERISRAVEYVGVMDTTITGSRSGFSPLMLWYALRRHGEAGLRDMVRKSIELASYAVERFQNDGVEAWRNSNSPIVVFPRPGKKIIEKWAIAPSGGIGHIVCLPHMDRAVVDEFIEDYLSEKQSKA
ncbi:histidine decarboxylase [Rubritalea halochordaticola]|uniref:Histidine decarboxylase n=2 Tax=Rubritalea halochordaticola TaxID=714537 RepID=A0ABP9UXV9_9BACT